ncbi:MAG: hypothetical protein CM1200mP2_07140 [Planctomycetaceae bacterium]|nr:MAG: hypothetical protein CM1200mP2_07140 [Planctomycetaceae bacterium]
MSGYLLLVGEKGLPLIEQLKLKNQFLVDANGKVLTDKKGRKKLVPFSETYAAMQALRFMWSYADGRIAKPRLGQSMRILLDRPKLADLVIADLARWKDWSIREPADDHVRRQGIQRPRHQGGPSCVTCWSAPRTFPRARTRKRRPARTPSMSTPL